MRSLCVAAAAAALTLTLAACGGSSSASSSTRSQPAGKTIAVTEKDFSITLAGGDHIAKPGRYTFAVTNKGPSSHNLTIDGPGVSNAATPIIGPGTTSVTVTLKAGKYDFFCSVPGHKELGMNANVTVG